MKTDRMPFKVEVDVDDRTGRPRAVYFQVRTGTVAETREIKPGIAFADYSAEGLLLGVELLAACEVRLLDQITLNEPANVQQFLRSAAPRELVCV
jgi:hypothetical protein